MKSRLSGEVPFLLGPGQQVTLSNAVCLYSAGDKWWNFLGKTPAFVEHFVFTCLT